MKTLTLATSSINNFQMSKRLVRWVPLLYLLLMRKSSMPVFQIQSLQMGLTRRMQSSQAQMFSSMLPTRTSRNPEIWCAEMLPSIISGIVSKPKFWNYAFPKCWKSFAETFTTILSRNIGNYNLQNGSNYNIQKC